MNVIKYSLSKVYLVLYSLVWFLYKSNIKKKYSFNQKIISIGNMTVGGSGKTPFVVSLSKILTKLNCKHAVVSRGYGRKKSATFMVDKKNNKSYNVAYAGDEPFMLTSMLPGVPVLVGDKVRAISLGFQKHKINTFVLDDGFQTFKLKKNVNIVLVDLSLTINDYQLLPLGLLREPVKAIRRADVVVFTKENLNSDKRQGQKIRGLFSTHINKTKQLCLHADFNFSLVLLPKNKTTFITVGGDNLVNEGILAFSGIANNKSFVSSLPLFFSTVLKVLSFKDHYQYKPSDIKTIKQHLTNFNITSIVTTRKDYVKIKECFLNYNIYIVDVEHSIKDIDQLENFIKSKL